jgi:hypothetical protein
MNKLVGKRFIVRDGVKIAIPAFFNAERDMNVEGNRFKKSGHKVMCFIFLCGGYFYLNV